MQPAVDRLPDHLRAAIPHLRVRAGPEVDVRVDGRPARAVAEPADEDELCATVRLAAVEGWRIHVRGTGGQEQLGQPIDAVDVVLSLARLSGVVEHAPEDLTLTAWAGTPLEALDQPLARGGQRLPIHPLAAHASLGGLVATGRSGPFRVGHRTPRDSVLGLRLCLADGAVVRTGGRVVKNVAGYDVTRLMVGSLGTLAVITQVCIRVSPVPRARATIAGAAADLRAAADVARAWAERALQPVALEWLDARAAAAVGLPDGPALLAAFEDEPEAVRAQVAEAGADGFAALSDERAAEAWRSLHALPGEASLLVRASAPPAALGDMWRDLEGARVASGQPALAASVSVAAGVGHLWGDAGRTGDDAAFVAAARPAPEQVGGALVLERAPVELRRRVGAFGRPPDALDRMRAVKLALDPGGILAPGRMPGDDS